MRINCGVATAGRTHTRDQVEIIAALADRVNRLTISRHDPEAFHAERSDISASLRSLARHFAQERQAK